MDFNDPDRANRRVTQEGLYSSKGQLETWEYILEQGSNRYKKTDTWLKIYLIK